MLTDYEAVAVTLLPLRHWALCFTFYVSGWQVVGWLVACLLLLDSRLDCYSIMAIGVATPITHQYGINIKSLIFGNLFSLDITCVCGSLVV